MGMPPGKAAANQHKRREPTSGLEPLTCSLRVCGQWLLSVAGSCKSRMGNELPAPVLSTIAGHCVRVRVKLGSASRRLRGAGSFAHLRVDNAGYGDSSDITALLIDRSRETSTSSLPRPSARPRIIATARAFMNLLERTELPQGTRLYKLRSSEEESLGKGILHLREEITRREP
jgi:hypothetical protein